MAAEVRNNDMRYSAVCDIRPLIETPGYKHFELAPTPDGTLIHARATFESQ